MDLGVRDVSRFGALQLGLFNMACIQCHGGNGGAGAAGLNLTEGRSYANLVNVSSTRKEGMMRVVGGNARESLLHQMMAAERICCTLTIPRYSAISSEKT